MLSTPGPSPHLSWGLSCAHSAELGKRPLTANSYCKPQVSAEVCTAGKQQAFGGFYCQMPANAAPVAAGRGALSSPSGHSARCALSACLDNDLPNGAFKRDYG